MMKICEVNKSGSVPSPCSEREARLWWLFVLGLLAANCSDREARVMVVVDEFKFRSFLFPFQLGSQTSKEVQAKFSTWRKSARSLG